MDESADVCSADLAVGAAVDAVGLGGQREGTAGRIDLQLPPGLDEALGDGGAAGRLLGDEPARDPPEAGPPEGEGAGLGAKRVEQPGRSEDGRVGKKWVSAGRARGAAYL